MQDIHQEVARRLAGLVEGSVSREEVADWALARIKDEAADYQSDAILWAALDRLAGADLQQSPGAYLHGDEDFRSWLNDFED
ncbi:hypothetical protein Q2K19_22115 [Micromonospora soli]|uniref:hypothetical protein n=1 Tax=Micromonospora sp. NBRC 110009 TaxID=3061627 RepID=UPI00267272EE|nr:hypothetical protein [Micromonospora sp. NBRC 110009]WKT96872.1 hypothetical protein Q2K19_22115 [Micromonospora sp. NBRC 110009]